MTFHRALSTLLFLTLSACGGDDDTGTSRAASTAQQRFVVHSAVSGADGSRSNYFSVADDLAAPTKLDYGKSIELGGRPRLYAAQALGFFAIADAESLSITRYDIADDGSLRAGAKLSLQPYGVSSLEPQGVHFVSASKAYYKDSKQAQVIVFDPTSMTIGRVLPLPRELIVPDRVVNVSRWAGRKGEAYLAVGTTDKDYTRTFPGTTLVRIDTATDELTTVRDERCRGLNTVATVNDALYFFSDVINGFGHAVYPDDAGQADCILRILPGQKTFDASYVGSIAPALGGQIGTVVAVTESGEAWAQVIDPTVMPKAPGTKYTDWYKAGWRWFHLPLASLSNAVAPDLAAGAYTAQTVTVGSAFYVSQASTAYGETTLIELSSGTPKPGVSFSGFPLDVVRVR